jgi:hypothetical protein
MNGTSSRPFRFGPTTTSPGQTATAHRPCAPVMLVPTETSSLWRPPFSRLAATFPPRDVDINTSDTYTPTHNQISGPITRARAHQLNNQVSSFQASYSSYLDNGNMCSILLLRNDEQEWNGVAFTPATFRFQNSSSLWWPPQPLMDLDSGVQILSRKLLESTFICIKPQVHIMSEPATIIILVQRPFCTNGAMTPYFGPLDRVSCWVQFGRVLGLEHDPAYLRSSSHTYKT